MTMRTRRVAATPKGGYRFRPFRTLRTMLYLLGPFAIILILFVYPSQLSGSATLSATTSRSSSNDFVARRLIETTAHNDAAFDTQSNYNDDESSDRITSKLIIQVSPSGSGIMNKYYHRFKNVVVSKTKITVYYGRGFTPPTREHWVDFISGNTTSPDPPTMFVIKGDNHSKKWYYLPIEYVSAAEQQPECSHWIDKPAYLLQVRYSYNIWHTWNEGLMGIFQTLREHGELPLVSIDDQGNMDEITQGMGDGCPWEYDPVQDKAIQSSTCGPRQGLIGRTTCDVNTEAWCRPGTVMSWRREGSGPVIVPYTASSVMNVWSHLYRAMTADIRDFGVVDNACFRDITVGKTSTLNFYQSLSPSASPLENFSSKLSWVDNVASRVEAMAVFKAFVYSSQKEWIRNEIAGNPAFKKWQGYRDPGMDRLRLGVGPEDMTALHAIVPKEVPGMLREELEDLQKMAKEKEETADEIIDGFVEAFGGAKPAFDAAAALRREKERKKALAKVKDSNSDDDTDYDTDYEEEQQEDVDGDSDDGSTSGILTPQKPAKKRFEDDEAEAALKLQRQQGGSGVALIRPHRGGGINRQSKRWAEQAMQEAVIASQDRRDAVIAALDAEVEEATVVSDSGNGNDKSGGVVQGATLTYVASEIQQQEQQVDDDEYGNNNNKHRHQRQLLGRAATHQQQQRRRSMIEDEANQFSSPSHKPFFSKALDFHHEQPRPVVTYSSRNFFSRGVLNEIDILEYILSHYNVTLKVTTFEEPLLEVMETLSHSDVFFGMHGAGWTNGLFIKRGAASLQMFPYGWRLPSGQTVRGFNYREIVLASECPYLEWVNPRPEHAFFRRIDYSKKWNATYAVHPGGEDPLPVNGSPGNHWIYQNTYVDMTAFGPVIDQMMKMAGIEPINQ